MEFTITLMDLGQIILLIIACYACYLKGLNKGIGDTLEFFEEQGLIEREEQCKNNIGEKYDTKN